MGQEETKVKIWKYVLIPDKVMRSKAIPHGAKLLLAYIMRLSLNKGYCWASNNHFAEFYKVDKATISRWINSLKDHRYIKCSKKVVKRKIYLDHRLLNNIRYCQVSKTSARMKKIVRSLAHFTKWQRKVEEKSKGKCMLCGLTEQQQEDLDLESIGLFVHHILPLTLIIDRYHLTNKEEIKKCKKLWDVNNGIVLCDPCHKMKHGLEYTSVTLDSGINCKNAISILDSEISCKNANIDTLKSIEHSFDAHNNINFEEEDFDFTDEDINKWLDDINIK